VVYRRSYVALSRFIKHWPKDDKHREENVNRQGEVTQFLNLGAPSCLWNGAWALRTALYFVYYAYAVT